jgi:GntR family transcriptional regulator, transcriptional repressor for pyruvate dehydrogenase complex
LADGAVWPDEDYEMSSAQFPTAAQRAANILREEILLLDEGQFFGMEAELAARLNIGAEIVRQALRLLQNEQFLTSKRGINGGYFVTRPSVQSAAHLAAVVLRARRANPIDSTVLSGLLITEAVRGAVRCADKQLFAAMAGLMPRSTRCDPAESAEEFFRGYAEFSQLLVEMSGNITLELLIGILMEYAHVQFEINIFETMSHRNASLVFRRRIGLAVLARNTNEALEAVEEQSRATVAWVKRQYRRNERLTEADKRPVRLNRVNALSRVQQ